MKKQILNLGTVLSKDEQLEVLGGHRHYLRKVGGESSEGSGCGRGMPHFFEFDVFEVGGGGNGMGYYC